MNKIEREDYIVDSDINKSLIYGECCEKDIFFIISSLKEKYNIENIIDIGSGCGKIVFYLADNLKDCIIEGIEIQKNRYEKASNLLNNKMNTNIVFYNDNFKNIYFGNYDLLFCCNTIFTQEDNNILYNKIINEFNGIFILCTLTHKLLHFFAEKKYIKCSWYSEIPVYIYINL